jgi:hypothetical protein
LLIAGSFTLTACPQTGPTATSTTSSSGSTFTASPRPSSSEAPSPTPTPTEFLRTDGSESSPEKETLTAGDGERQAQSCLPGVWSVDMPSYVKGRPIPGKKKYVSGTYTFDFASDFGFSANHDDVTMRLSMKKDYVDVHNTWQESGIWVNGLDSDGVDEALFILGAPFETTAQEAMLVLGIEDPKQLVFLYGTSFTSLDSYGLVNGRVKTSQMSREGTAISAIGEVDCVRGEMSLGVRGAGSQVITLRKMG